MVSCESSCLKLITEAYYFDHILLSEFLFGEFLPQWFHEGLDCIDASQKVGEVAAFVSCLQMSPKLSTLPAGNGKV